MAVNRRTALYDPRNTAMHYSSSALNLDDLRRSLGGSEDLRVLLQPGNSQICGPIPAHVQALNITGGQSHAELKSCMLLHFKHLSCHSQIMS